MTFEEVSSITYRSFEEHSLKWGKRIRSLGPGEAMLQMPGTAEIQAVKIDHLRVPESQEINDKVERLLEKNFASDFFMTMAAAQKEHDLCLHQILSDTLPSLTVDSPQTKSGPDNPFAL